MSRYHRLSVSEKRTEGIARMREPAVACPGGCGTHVMRTDLLAHLDHRCPGPREPGPGSKWLSHHDAITMGVSKETLSFWARKGRVRTRGARGERQYLHGDLVDRIAEQRIKRRRQCNALHQV